MQVTLRIVGLFFNKKVDIDSSVTTVKGVMEAYINAGNSDISQPGGLTYVEDNKSPYSTLKEVSFHYEGTYDFNPNNATPPKNKTLGGKTLSPGKRTLRELRVDDNVILAWQYYVISKGGTNKSRTKQAEGFTPFGKKTSTYEIKEGDTIIWRLVAINLTEEESKYKYTA